MPRPHRVHRIVREFASKYITDKHLRPNDINIKSHKNHTSIDTRQLAPIQLLNLKEALYVHLRDSKELRRIPVVGRETFTKNHEAYRKTGAIIVEQVGVSERKIPKGGVEPIELEIPTIFVYDPKGAKKLVK